MSKLRPVFTVILLATSSLFAQGKRPLKLDDLARIREVSDPQISPDGNWIAYVVGATDVKEDKSHTHVWVASYDGKEDRQFTFSQDSESSPRWSPDGKYLAFISDRPGPAKHDQVWLMDRNGGEAWQLTDTKGHLRSLEWSPDSKRLALVIEDPDPNNPEDQEDQSVAAAGTSTAAAAHRKPPKPIVIDRYHYKQDIEGYLLSNRHTYIYLFDLTTKKTARLTKGKTDEVSPAWSPDGRWIAYLDDHSPDPDRDEGSHVFIAEAKPGSAEHQITPNSSRDQRSRLEWSFDGKRVMFIEGDEKKYAAYNMPHLATVPADGSAAPSRFQPIEALDRGISDPRFVGDTIEFLVVDDRSEYPAELRMGTDKVERLMKPPVVLSNWTMAAGHTAALCPTDVRPDEVCALENGALRQITHQNGALFSELELGRTEDISFKAKDGTDVHGLLTYPVGYIESTKIPLLLRIHGGPDGQDEHSFSFERQFFAANGYAVLNVNYRGSAGRGMKYSRAIFADWGHYEVEDLEAGVNHVIEMGLADPQRLGVGGWSYGGILTDYMIASDTRFKAATSGAGTAFTVAFYGTDQYIVQYDYEIGPPWEAKAWETYVKISYPFLHADRIQTPTLFLGGERDFNVPVQGSQQMYEALRSLGRETQLVIYPNEFHGIKRPSYIRDRYERYLAWYDKYLKPPPQRKQRRSRIPEALPTTTNSLRGLVPRASPSHRREACPQEKRQARLAQNSSPPSAPARQPKASHRNRPGNSGDADGL
ncbi:MAG TPA: S9 family peptidase [Terriglobales bacterium]|nr:S9 family peptidase [Terriglobales bacterium]